jgi:hypothetical protein
MDESFSQARPRKEQGTSAIVIANGNIAPDADNLASYTHTKATQILFFKHSPDGLAKENMCREKTG